MVISPVWAQAVISNRFDLCKLITGFCFYFWGTFINITKHIRFSGAGSAGAVIPQGLKRNNAFGIVSPFDQEKIVDQFCIGNLKLGFLTHDYLYPLKTTCKFAVVYLWDTTEYGRLASAFSVGWRIRWIDSWF